MKDALALFEDLEAEEIATAVAGPVKAGSLGETDNIGLPFRPCVCGGHHYWKDQDSWRCSICYPMSRPFLGETCTVDGPSLPVTEVSRDDLEQIHPAIVQGIPLPVILDQADESDYPDLVDLAVMETFVASLTAPGNPLWKYRPEPEQAPTPRAVLMVRC